MYQNFTRTAKFIRKAIHNGILQLRYLFLIFFNWDLVDRSFNSHYEAWSYNKKKKKKIKAYSMNVLLKDVC